MHGGTEEADGTPVWEKLIWLLAKGEGRSHALLAESEQRRQSDHPSPRRELPQVDAQVSRQQEGDSILYRGQSVLRAGIGRWLHELFRRSGRYRPSQPLESLFNRTQQFILRRVVDAGR